MLVLMNAIKEMHVLCIALATATETVQGHNQGEWLRVVMTSWHPEKCVPPLLADCYIGMFISVVGWSISIIRAITKLRAFKLW